MPNWADDEGNYYWQPPGAQWWDRVQIAHPPLTIRKGCCCAYCKYHREEKKRGKRGQET